MMYYGSFEPIEKDIISDYNMQNAAVKKKLSKSIKILKNRKVVLMNSLEAL